MTRTVAIVEDDAPIRDNYADALRRQGYRVQTFANRGDAMAAFRSRIPDLVLLDIALRDSGLAFKRTGDQVRVFPAK